MEANVCTRLRLKLKIVKETPGLALGKDVLLYDVDSGKILPCSGISVGAQDMKGIVQVTATFPAAVEISLPHPFDRPAKVEESTP